ncbi:hypothetical protein D3C76_1322250 [compost metagenome]|jgi:hypothetical protein
MAIIGVRLADCAAAPGSSTPARWCPSRLPRPSPYGFASGAPFQKKPDVGGTFARTVASVAIPAYGPDTTIS